MRIWLLLILGQVVFLSAQHVLVLGVAQDGGYPHAGCKKQCCSLTRNGKVPAQFVTSLAITDTSQKKWWLVEASPDISHQLHLFDSLTNHIYPYLPSGILITHAHIGHYTGLMHLGREVMNTTGIPVYALETMCNFLSNNGPWSQLISLNNILLKLITKDSTIILSKDVNFRAFTVPHRDEFSETAGFSISVRDKNYLFIPDIDKWQKWNQKLTDILPFYDVAFLDGTFMKPDEINNRDIAEIPHPFIGETVSEIKDYRLLNKVRFIHFNHTNRAMWDTTIQHKLREEGIQPAYQGFWY